MNINGAEGEQLNLLGDYLSTIREFLTDPKIERPEHWGAELHMGLKGMIDQFDALNTLARPDRTIPLDKSSSEIREDLSRHLTLLRQQLDEIEVLSESLLAQDDDTRKLARSVSCLLLGMRRVSGACLEFAKRLSEASAKA